MKYILLLIISALYGFAAFGAQAPLSSAHTKPALVAQYDAVIPGKPLRLGLLLEHDKNWHSYWENPGDAGLPTEISWELPEGFVAGAIDWPPPMRIKEGDLAVYAYKDEVFLPVNIEVPARLSEAQYTLKAKASWLACDDVCIPESMMLEISLPVADVAAKSSAAVWFEKHDTNQPIKINEPVSTLVADQKLYFEIALEKLGGGEVDSAYFFARTQNMLLSAAPQEALNINGRLKVSASLAGEAPQENIGGLLEIKRRDETKFYDITLLPAASVESPQSAPMPAQESTGFLAILVFALLGGMILNLMPCVLPVLSLKALAIARKSGKARSETIKHGVAYTLGILFSFACIAALLLALKNSGEAVGWGYQMQSPAFVGFLIYLLFLVGLNLSGYFDLPVLFGSSGNQLASENSARGSFFTGMLATLVATPCTAPFMASAVGLALTLPGWQAMLVFEMLGFGLALPFLLISIFPSCLKLLPRPGAWMETFKQFLAFPMYASVIWLLWVLAIQTGADGLLVATVSMLALAITIWMRRIFHTALIYRITAIIFYAVIILWSLPMLENMPRPESNHSKFRSAGEIEFSAQALADLRRAGTPVFVDATAAWCITCQVNKRVIHSKDVQAFFKEKNISLMVADWTLRDAEIGAWLSSFGYEGVPLYVYYPPQGSPVVLPQLLTSDIMKDRLK